MLHVVTLTLDKMAGGGMYDQLGGGFHRYSVDERWLVPHFEKMLYDNALLVPCYLDGAFRALPPGEKLPTPVKLTLLVGEPLTFAELPDERASWQEITARLEASVSSLAASASPSAR